MEPSDFPDFPQKRQPKKNFPGPKPKQGPFPKPEAPLFQPFGSEGGAAPKKPQPPSPGTPPPRRPMPGQQPPGAARKAPQSRAASPQHQPQMPEESYAKSQLFQWGIIAFAGVFLTGAVAMGMIFAIGLLSGGSSNDTPSTLVQNSNQESSEEKPFQKNAAFRQLSEEQVRIYTALFHRAIYQEPVALVSIALELPMRGHSHLSPRERSKILEGYDDLLEKYSSEASERTEKLFKRPSPTRPSEPRRPEPLADSQRPPSSRPAPPSIPKVERARSKEDQVPKIDIKRNQSEIRGADLAEITFKTKPYAISHSFEQEIWIYLPHRVDRDKPLSCVYIPASDMTYMHGSRLKPKHRAEHLPFVEAGFAVIAFSVSGQVPEVYQDQITPTWLDQSLPPGDWLSEVYAEYSKVNYGLHNAEIAKLFAEKNLPKIDEKQQYTVGFGFAANLAFAIAKEQRLRGCLLYSPTLSLQDRIRGLDSIVELLDKVEDFDSKVTHPYSDLDPMESLTSYGIPGTYLYVSPDDPAATPSFIDPFVKKMRKDNRQITFKLASAPGNQAELFDKAIPEGVEFLQALNRQIPLEEFNLAPEEILGEKLEQSFAANLTHQRDVKARLSGQLRREIPSVSPLRIWPVPDPLPLKYTDHGKETNPAYPYPAGIEAWNPTQTEPYEGAADEPRSIRPVAKNLLIEMKQFDYVVFPEDPSSPYVAFIGRPASNSLSGLRGDGTAYEVWDRQRNWRVAVGSSDVKLDFKTCVLSDNGRELIGYPELLSQKSSIVMIELGSSVVNQFTFPAQQGYRLDASNPLVFWGDDSIGVLLPPPDFGVEETHCVLINKRTKELDVYRLPGRSETRAVKAIEPKRGWIAQRRDVRVTGLNDSQKIVELYDVQEERQFAQLLLPNFGDLGHVESEGLQFSHDRKWLAYAVKMSGDVLSDSGGELIVVYWNLETGELHRYLRFYLPEYLRHSIDRYQGPFIQWMPNDRGWLISGCYLVHFRHNGDSRNVVDYPDCILPVPKEQELHFPARKFVGQGQILLVYGDEEKRLTVYPIVDNLQIHHPFEPEANK
ncbi:Hypothetical protein PBC10988_41150 [Planctomycetales bacterium 10988]|nr:Hypothetical protein PBC10988_41150 [Planctomycetales bacterium 10988]